jgi:hypothetical protein
MMNANLRHIDIDPNEMSVKREIISKKDDNIQTTLFVVEQKRSEGFAQLSLSNPHISKLHSTMGKMNEKTIPSLHLWAP